MSEAFPSCFRTRFRRGELARDDRFSGSIAGTNFWRYLYDVRHSCHCRETRPRRILVYVMFLILSLAMVVTVSAASALGKTPDTHLDSSQHGDFRF